MANSELRSCPISALSDEYWGQLRFLGLSKGQRAARRGAHAKSLPFVFKKGLPASLERNLKRSGMENAQRAQARSIVRAASEAACAAPTNKRVRACFLVLTRRLPSSLQSATRLA